MKKTAAVLAALLLLTACAKKTEALPDTYAAGSDFQHFQQSTMASRVRVQEGEGGFYILKDDFVYYYSDRAGIMVPLCSRPNCLHDRESDPERRRQCVAYVEAAGYEPSIQYYEGDVYFFGERVEEGESGTLDNIGQMFRISGDGTAKDLIREWPANYGLSSRIIHRGELYYIAGYPNYGEEAENPVRVEKLSLKRIGAKPEVLYNSEGVWGFNLNCLCAYGNHIYVYYDCAGKEDRRGGWIVYDTRSGSTEELAFYDDGESLRVGSLAFWQDRIVFVSFHADDPFAPIDPYASEKLYSAALDGSDLRVLKEDIPAGWSVASDGETLFLHNCYMVINGIEEEKVFHAYGPDMEEIDSFSIPDNADVLPAPWIGAPERQVLIREDADGWGLLIWDKEDLGSLKGAPYSPAFVRYE